MSHKVFLLVVGMNATAFVILSAVVRPAPSFATPTVGAPVASPATISVGEPTEVTVTSQITTGPSDPAVIPTSVYLQRLDAAGKVIASLGTMRDDGSAGDALAGDGVFTLRVTLNELNPGEVRLRVSAAFRKLLRRVLSQPSTLSVWSKITNTDFGVTLNVPPNWDVDQDSLEVVGHSPGVPPPSAPESLEGTCKISVIPVDNPENLSLQDMVSRFEADLGAPEVISKVFFTVAGKQAVQIVTHEMARQTTTWLAHDGRIVAVQLVCEDDFLPEGERERVYRTLLETLEF